MIDVAAMEPVLFVLPGSHRPVLTVRVVCSALFVNAHLKLTVGVLA